MTEAAPAEQSQIVIDIYVSDHCAICAYAHEVAAMIRREFPAVVVHLIRMGEPGVDLPESVFATPTYLLNGERWSLGNPAPEEVRRVLS